MSLLQHNCPNHHSVKIVLFSQLGRVSVLLVCDIRLISTMELTTTNKGKQCALYDGYSYNFKRQNAEGTIFWRCSKQRSKRCRGIMKSKTGEVLSTSEHQCGAPDEARLEVKKILQQAKKRAREEDTAVSKIYNQELGELHNKGYEFVTEMPAEPTTKRVLYQQRCKSQGNQAEPDKRDDVVLDEDILKMKDGSSFLLADDTSGERILIFSGTLGKEGLTSCDDFLWMELLKAPVNSLPRSIPFMLIMEARLMKQIYIQ